MSGRATIGVFGGSGFGRFLEGAEEVRVETPYGDPSDAIRIADVEGQPVAFLPRHGRDHALPPHRIPYRANLWAMRELGVERILAPCAAGSLDPGLPPGAFCVVDQFVDRTSGRVPTFYDGPGATHVSTADPYCPHLRDALLEAGRRVGADVRDGGTMVVVEGPRFSTRAESRWYRQMGWQVINMTGYPEAALARELELCYASIALITDYDTGVDLDAGQAVTADDVLTAFAANLDILRDLLVHAIGSLSVRPADDPCRSALAGARL
ncbi:MAG: S-methyl-5'-thioadenosine phosphorylase [Actinobacteria bacterium]|nr:S-methyl-5'-thioadenosine phosphorylase [Actinomycetota bacterium]